MKRILWLSSIATLAISAPAFAADNVSVKDATGATVSTASKDVSGVHFRKDICVTLADTTIDCFTELNASLRAEDTASGDADSGLPIFAVRKATPANTSGTDGDYEALQISAGRLWTDAGALLPTSLGAKVGTGSLSVVPASDGFGVNATQTGTWNITNISGTVSLPTGAATAAKQPALGTAGSSSADVITVQGITGGTNLNVNCAAGCAGGTQYAEDAVAASGNSGTAALGVQVASPASTAADGDWTWAQFTNGKLHVIDLSANSAIGTASDTADTTGTCTLIGCIGSIRDDIHTMATDTTPVASNITQIGGNAILTGNGATGTGAIRVSLASDSTGQVVLAAGSAVAGKVGIDQTTPGTTNLVNTYGFAGTATATFNRPADATAYTANDTISDSTTTPTTGGFTFSNVCRISGGSGIGTDLYVLSNDTAALAGKVLVYDSAVTAANDNAAEAISDADAAKLVAEIPFTLAARANNASAHIQNLNFGYTCAGSANLRFLVVATGGTLTTASANTYTFRLKFIASN